MMKLNNKGQTLVMFVILIPIILMVIVLVYDLGNALYEKERLDNTSYLVIDYGLDNISEVDENKLISLIQENSNDLSSIKVLVDKSTNSITIRLAKRISGTLGFDLIEIKSNYMGSYNDNKKIIDRVGD